MTSSVASQRLTRAQLARIVLPLTVARLSVNIARRFPYPFLPAISRGLGVPLSSVQSVSALQAGIGITSPLFGGLADRYGRKRVMLATLGLMTGAAVGGALLPQFAVFALVMVLLGVGKMLFDPAGIAYVGDRVPYAQRGAALGMLELAWAGSLIIASPVVGFLLQTSGLQAVFFALSMALAATLGLVWLVIPSDYPNPTARASAPPLNPLRMLRIVGRSRAASAALGYVIAIGVANELVFINYGAFMETSFGLLPLELGALTTVIALAEVCGELLVIGIADKFGKKRLALTGALLASAMYVVLPLASFSLPLALASVFVMFLGVETAIVASIPLYTEVLPEARSMMFSAVIGASSVGRFTGSVLGGILYRWTGSFLVLGVLSMGIVLVGAALLWRFVPDEAGAIV
ncbi:MAG: MFS transporter [Armatimonadetes bacterium]|nr:MFS transporter [Anaerolineae bacterium]